MKRIIIKEPFKILILAFFLLNFVGVGCSKGGSLISGSRSSSSERGDQVNNSKSGVPGGSDGENNPNGVPGGSDGENGPNGVPGGGDGSNSGEETYQFSITQSAHEQKEVDILMAIDNSCSMYGTCGGQNRIESLSKRFGNLLNEGIQRVDWQMAFISSCFGVKRKNGSYYEEKFYDLLGLSDNTHQILSPQLEDPETIFQETIFSKQGGECSYSEFQAILNVINSPETHPEGLFRPDALLAIVIITDERDTTDVKALDIITAVQDNFGQSKQFAAYGLIVEPGDVACDLQEPDVHYKVDDLVQRTGGVTGSICATDYSNIMAKIGAHIEKVLVYHEVILKHTNVIGSSINLNCTLSTSAIACPTWEFDSEANKILFDTPPAEGVTVQISYSYQSE